ncbi:MAG: glycosyltransferase family 61 protein [Candidatus Sedimenticola sp. (ex Thyasira tokunagai)]
MRRRFAIYVETISTNEVGNVIVNKLYEETFSLSNEERNYLESLPQSSGELVINGKLNLKKRFEMTIVSNCSVLGKVSVSLHLPTEKLLTRKKFGRNMAKMFHYQSADHIEQLVIPFISTPRGHDHYFHFILHRFVALIYALKKIPQAREAVVLIRRGIPAFQISAFNFLTKQYPRLIIREISSTEKIDCDHLLILEETIWEPIGNLAGGKIIQAVRDAYISEYELIPPPKSRLLYISRKRQKQRLMLNEEQLIEHLEHLGFEIICPELLPHKEQVALFSAAKVVVATTGAALTNLLFCQPECNVIEIRPETYDYPLFLGLCKQMSLNHYHFSGSTTTGKDMFSVDIEKLCELVRQVSTY